ncbi:AAA family ATPase [Sorangium sp. So ce1389]|uniref:AAA family ATPase n=1 Tax=Sorangium sp. So ce1389 TaxID=3133336 RepID=UPI003F5E967D
MPLRIPLGISDFRELREKGLEYIDKSGLLVEMIDREGTKVLLLPRPRRFGKTLNLSMLRCFFERRPEDLSHLFQDLSVWSAGDAYRRHFQRYPVVFLTFRDVKASTFEGCWADLTRKVQALYDEHRAVLEGSALSALERRNYAAILDGTAEPALYRQALGDLSRYLHRATGERAIILIDEYDEPIHAGFIHGYAREVLEFFRAFLTVGLKDNPHLERGVVTGILRIARESIFSGLNNLAVYTLLQRTFSTCFGFTEPEVESLMARAGQRDAMDLVRAWYNGYDFGGTVIYNPWSVLSYLADQEPELKPYWLNTSSNDLIKGTLEKHAARLGPTLEALLRGEGFETVLDENVALDRVDQSDAALWSLLVFSGYLKAEKRPRGSMEQAAHRLSIPNREVRLLYSGTFQEWLEARMRDHGTDLHRLVQGLLGGDAALVERQLGAFVKNVLSYHDLGADSTDAPESVYQVFVLGLLAALEPGHRVRSNRESGKGRPDVLILPSEPGRPGVVLELKVARGKRTLEQALDDGIEQVRGKDYAAELRAAGADPFHVLVIAFDGKEVRVRRAGADMT